MIGVTKRSIPKHNRLISELSTRMTKCRFLLIKIREMQVRENVLRFIHNRRALLGAVNENIYPIMHVGV